MSNVLSQFLKILEQAAQAGSDLDSQFTWFEGDNSFFGTVRCARLETEEITGHRKEVDGEGSK